MGDFIEVCSDKNLLIQGAEARIYECDFLGKPSIVKVRFSKKYRHPELDLKLTHKRLTSEARALSRCRKIGVNTPAVYFVDTEKNIIVLERLDAMTLKEHILVEKDGFESKASDYPSSLEHVMELVGRDLSKLHSSDIIHGDLTTSNILVKPGCQPDDLKIFFIDFGLSSTSRVAEDKGVDLYVLEKAFLSTHPNSEPLFSSLIKAYKMNWKNSQPVMNKFEEVKMRGRKRTMVG